MSTIGYINVSLETFGGILSLIFILCLSITRSQKERLDRLYIRMLLCNTILLFCDAAAWLFKGKTDWFSFFIVRAANFFVFTLGYLILVLFTHYLLCYLQTKQAGISLKPLYLMGVLMLVAAGLVVISQFNGMYYLIDEQNIYHRQDWFWLSQMFGIAGMLLNGTLLLYCRKSLNKKELCTFGIYILLPAAAMTMQILLYGIAVLYLATTICLLCIYISIQLALAQETGTRELELERAKSAVMLSKIQPHFLYNSLVSIKELCDTGEQQSTSHALEHFAYYLRGNLDSLSDVRLIPFEKELGHVRDYLYLEKIRFEDRLNIVWELTATDFFLPPLSLQPIVENAVRHGITEKKGGGILTIRTEKAQGNMIITVTDDGVGFALEAVREDGRTHVGIDNVRNRLRTQCGGSLLMESVVGSGTTAKIVLPGKEAMGDENFSG